MAELTTVLKILQDECDGMTELFYTEDWKKFKFGQGGPYKRTLSLLQKKANDYDQIIFDFFGAHEETASFNKLIVICLKNETPKELYKNVDTFKRQLKRMKGSL